MQGEEAEKLTSELPRDKVRSYCRMSPFPAAGSHLALHGKEERIHLFS
jgi:hypothetical protein